MEAKQTKFKIFILTFQGLSVALKLLHSHSLVDQRQSLSKGNSLNKLLALLHEGVREE